MTISTELTELYNEQTGLHERIAEMELEESGSGKSLTSRQCEQDLNNLYKRIEDLRKRIVIMMRQTEQAIFRTLFHSEESRVLTRKFVALNALNNHLSVSKREMARVKNELHEIAEPLRCGVGG